LIAIDIADMPPPCLVSPRAISALPHTRCCYARRAGYYHADITAPPPQRRRRRYVILLLLRHSYACRIRYSHVDITFAMPT